MSDLERLIVVDITENEKASLDGSIDLKTITGEGKIIIKNPSQKSRLWNLISDLKEVVNTSIDSRELNVGTLNPGQEFEKEYSIQNLKSACLKVNEIFDTDIGIPDIVNKNFLLNSENICNLKLAVVNKVDVPILNIKIIREMPDILKNIEIKPVNNGNAQIKEENGKKSLLWEIPKLDPKEIIELEILCSVHINVREDQPLGALTISYLINKHKLTMIEPEIIGLTDSMSGVDRDEGSDPGTWDCNVEFINESEFQVKLDSVKVSHKIATGSEIVVSQTPNKTILPNSSWDYDFHVEAKNVPELDPSFEFTPLYVVISRVNGEIKKESTIYPVLSAEVEKIITPPEVVAYATTGMTIEIIIKNNGTANIETLSVSDEIPQDFIPSELTNINILLEGEGDTLTISSRPEYTKNISMIPNDLAPSHLHRLNIKLFNLEKHFIPGSTITLVSSIEAKNPKPGEEYKTPIKVIANTKVKGKPFGVSPDETPQIRIKYVKRKLKTLKSIKPGLTEGSFSISIRIQNKGDVELENILVKDKIPKGFSLADLTPSDIEYEVIKDGEESELQIKLNEVREGESINIDYNCSGEGEYPRTEPQVIVQGREGASEEGVGGSAPQPQAPDVSKPTIGFQKQAEVNEELSKLLVNIERGITANQLSELMENVRDCMPQGPSLNQFMHFMREIKNLGEQMIIGSLRDDTIAKITDFKKKYS